MRYFLATLATAAALATIPARAHAADILVAIGGTDNATCGGRSNPCATIQFALLNRVQNSDRVLVSPGDHAGFLVVGPEATGVEIVSAGSPRARITMPAPTMMVPPGSIVPRITIVNATGWHVKGLDIVCAENACAGIALANVIEAHIVDNRIEGGTGGIYATGTSPRLLIADNQVHETSGFGIALAIPPPGNPTTDATAFESPRVERNFVDGVRRAGDQPSVGILLQRSRDLRVVNNGVNGVFGYGIALGDPVVQRETGPGLVAHNTVEMPPTADLVTNPAVPVFIAQIHDVTFQHNVFTRLSPGPGVIIGPGVRDAAMGNRSERNAFGRQIDTGPMGIFAVIVSTTGTTGTLAFPQWQMLGFDAMPVLEGSGPSLLMPASRLHLAPDSPAINAATSNASGVSDDFDREPRADGRPDLGFDEVAPMMPDAGVVVPDVVTGDDAAIPEDGGANTDVVVVPPEDAEVPPTVHTRGGACAVTQSSPTRSRAIPAGALVTLGALATAIAARRRRGPRR